ncbi:hypothetical protein HYU07_01650 [Candidatus Woesearchaeota archaeon]|nr:hypothetical protein [Candidatus Woesearchaeota archaeon]
MGIVALCKNIDGAIKRFGAEGESQEEYFSTVIRYCDRTQKQLVFEGYDAPFMNREATVDALKRAIDRSVKIYAIVSEGIDTVLEKLAEENESVKVIKTPRYLVIGAIAFDNDSVHLWDATKPTVYAPEQSNPHHYAWPVEKSGIYVRWLFESIKENRFVQHRFKEAAERLTNGQFKDQLLVDIYKESSYVPIAFIKRDTKFLAQKYAKKFDRLWKNAEPIKL